MNYFGLFIVNKLLSVCFIILENELAYPPTQQYLMPLSVVP